MMANLEKMFRQADRYDLSEGLLAYQRYHQLMKALAEKYQFSFPRTIAAFCALSPNNDYFGNLRSVVSVMNGINRDVPLAKIGVSTYKHCRDRAHSYLIGASKFVSPERGLKTLNFYHNILDPSDNRYVTIDGHIKATWLDKNLTMKEAIVKSRKEYNEISGAIKSLAFKNFMLPHQYQATIWFTRKRVLTVKYNPQAGLLFGANDLWRTLHDINDIKPYEDLE